MATPPNTRPAHLSCSQPGSSCTPCVNRGRVNAASHSAVTRQKKTMAQLADIKANEVLLACAIGDLAWLKRGISGGSNPGATNREGLNGLHLSAKNGHFDCLKYLVNNSDLDIDTLSEQSKASPLHYSVQVKNGTKMYQCMKLLLDKGADHRIKDIHGQSILHFAARSGNVKCLKLLLECGVSIHDKDNNGKTAYDIACLSNNYESARLLGALHWAHKKDVAQIKKLKNEQLLQRRVKQQKTIQAQLASQRAEIAYTKWLEKKHIANAVEPPQECEKRKESIASPYLESFVCETCSKPSKECSRQSHKKDKKLSVSIQMSYHQEERNLESVGKPDKLQPYTNLPPVSKKPGKGRRVSDATSSSGSGRGSRASSIPTAGIKFYAKRLRLGGKGDAKGSRRKSKGDTEPPIKTPGKVETAVSSVPDASVGISLSQQDFSHDRREHEISVDAPDSDKQTSSDSDELDFSKLNDVQLAYPQYDFDVEDDSSLFHDVGDFNDLDSLSLPTIMTKDKTPAEILQLLRKIGRPGSPADGRRYRRSNSYSHSSKQARSLSRRLSLGSIPEGKIVTDYKEELDEENDINSQFFRDLENTIRGFSSAGEEGREDGGERPPSADTSSDEGSSPPAPDPHTDFGLLPPPVLSSGTPEEEILGTKAQPPKTLTILNFEWDPGSNLVHTEMSSTPITPMDRKLSLKSLMTLQQPHDVPVLEVTPPSPIPTHLTLSEEAPARTRKITPPSRKVTPPPQLRKSTPPPHEVIPSAYSSEPKVAHDTSGDTTESDDVIRPLRKITPPSRKITPPSRRNTPPSRKITPPLREVSPLCHAMAYDSGSSSSNDSLVIVRRPISPGATTPPVNSSLHSVPFHTSLSEPCLAPTQEELHADTAPTTPLFYLEESEETEEAHDISTTGQHSLFALSKSPMSQSMVLSSTHPSPEGQSDILGSHSASAPAMAASHSFLSSSFLASNSMPDNLGTNN